MEIKYNKLLIIDLSHMLHRNISQPNLWEMRNAEGTRTGGIYGTLQSLLKETSNYNYFPVIYHLEDWLYMTTIKDIKINNFF